MVQGLSSRNEGTETVSVTVYVRPLTWKRLNARKDQGVSFDDVISELLDDADEAQTEDTR